MGSRRQRKHWILVESESSSGNLLRISIEQSGREVLRPLYREAARRGVRRVLPLLENYLLVRVDRRDDLVDLRSMRGLRSIARGADGGDSSAPPAIVPDWQVDRILALVGDDGYVQLASENPP